MSEPNRRQILDALLERHGRTYAAEAGIRLRRATPAPLFQLLCLSILLSARIRADAAVEAARGLGEAGWTTPAKMASSTWEQRTRVLNESGYARYDESTSRMLADSVETLDRRYDGDLRRLRDEADHDAQAERELLQQFTGIGEVGAAIFAREVQFVWTEQYPFAAERELATARQLGLPDDAAGLAGICGGRDEFTRVVAALVRCGLADGVEEIRAAAGVAG